ncbi:MAG: uracil-DNA glycosylase [Pseudomonadota bacterium]
MGQTHDLHELLQWYHDAGVDLSLEDAPVDRFAESARMAEAQVAKRAAKLPTKGQTEPQAQKRAVPPSVTGKRTEPATSKRANAPGPAVVQNSETVAQAKALAEQADNLDALKFAIEGFEGCNLKFTAKSTVFADGNPKARLMLVGEAPGREEDEQGVPFVGRSGQMLDKILKALSYNRSDVYITNVLPWRPPGNRTPTPAESEICRPFLEKHIALVNPHILVAVGGAATKTLLSTKEGIVSLRGRWQSVTFGNSTYALMPTFHPSYLLRSPSQKKYAWHDWQMVKARMETEATRETRDVV